MKGRSAVKTLALIAAILLCVAGADLYVLRAQNPVPGATPVQPVQPFYNCNQQATATGAANTAVTATLTPPAGQYVYVCSIYIATANNAALTAAAGPAPIFTTTGLQNQLVWWGDNSVATTGTKVLVTDQVYPLLIKSNAPGTAFTIVTSAGQSTQNARINVTAFFAP
jgi:hypothetical protein